MVGSTSKLYFQPIWQYLSPDDSHSDQGKVESQCHFVLQFPDSLFIYLEATFTSCETHVPIYGCFLCLILTFFNILDISSCQTVLVLFPVAVISYSHKSNLGEKILLSQFQVMGKSQQQGLELTGDILFTVEMHACLYSVHFQHLGSSGSPVWCHLKQVSLLTSVNKYNQHNS